MPLHFNHSTARMGHWCENSVMQQNHTTRKTQVDTLPSHTVTQ